MVISVNGVSILHVHPCALSIYDMPHAMMLFSFCHTMIFVNHLR